MRSHSLSLSDSLRLLPVARQALLSMGFSRQEYWCWLPFPTSRDFPNAGIEPALLNLLHRQADSLPLSHLGSPSVTYIPSPTDKKTPNQKPYTHTHTHTHTHIQSHFLLLSLILDEKSSGIYTHGPQKLQLQRK